MRSATRPLRRRPRRRPRRRRRRAPDQKLALRSRARAREPARQRRASGGARPEGPLVQLAAMAHRDRRRLGNLVPEARKVRERLRDDQTVLGGEALKPGVVGVQAPHRVRVGRGEQGPRLAVGRIAHRPQSGAVRHAEAPLNGIGDPMARGHALDEPECSLERLRSDRPRGRTSARDGRQPRCRSSPWTSANSAGSMASMRSRRIRCEVGDESVVDEQPAAVTERVAVRLLHRRANRRSHVRQEQRRTRRARRAPAGSRPTRPACTLRYTAGASAHCRTSRARSRRRSSARLPSALAGL